MHYSKPQILRTQRATAAIQNSKTGIGTDNSLQMTVPAYQADRIAKGSAARGRTSSKPFDSSAPAHLQRI